MGCGLCGKGLCACGDELITDGDQATGMCRTCRFLQQSDLQELLIAAIKELGEIAECIIKDDRPGHWKNELGDLCELAIAPMLGLAETDFDLACELGRKRKREKMEASNDTP